MTRVGAIFNPYTHSPEEFLPAIQSAEGAGVDEVWIWEDCFRTSGFAAAAAALASTDRLRIGIGIAPMPLRNVALTAMEIATLERLFPGRLLPGLGHGVLDWMGQVHARVASPLTLMREYLPALRSLLAGDEVSADGRYVSLEKVRLDFAPAEAPRVYAAAEGPKTLRLAGAVADGVVLDSKHTVDEVSAAVEAVREGRREAGRTGSPDVVAYVVAAFGADAERRVRADLAGLPDLSERVLFGDPAAVAEGVARFAAAGVDDVVLLPLSRQDTGEFSTATAEVARILALTPG